MKRMIKGLLAVILCLTVLTSQSTVTQAATPLDLDSYEILTVGQTKSIFKDGYSATSYTLTTSSKDESVCIVDKTYGILMPIGEGSTKVTVKAKKGSTTYSKTFIVYVEDPGDVKVGCDISYWNGTIDANKLKNGGIDYAIFRAGHTHAYAKTTTYSSGEDKKFKDDVTKAEKASLEYGTYWYIDCTTTTAAKKEANAYYNVLDKYNVLDSDLCTYPIFLDIEGRCQSLSKSKLLSVVKAFINQLISCGVDEDRINIYANKTCYESKLNDSYYNKYYANSWFARYGTSFYSNHIGCRPTYKTTATYAPKMWQIGSSFVKKSKGISSTYIDMNYYYTADKTKIHTYSNIEVKAPTCDEDGSISYTCNVCGTKSYKLSNKLGHNYIDPVFNFSEDGKSATVSYTCSKCNDVVTYDADITSKVKVKATCTNKGTTTYTATYGNDSKSINIEDIEMLEHTVVETKQIDPTCTKDGLTAGSYCSVCKQNLSGREVIKAIGHNYEDVTLKATLTKDGYTGQRCSNCENVINKTVYRYAKTVALSTDTYTYDGKEKNPKVIIKDSKGKVIDSSNYTVEIPEGRTEVGTYDYTVTFKNNYEGSKTLTLTVLPKATSISSLKKYNNAFGIKIKAREDVTGYQISYSTSSKFKGAKTQLLTETSQKITGLKNKKKYYVRVRTYVTVNDTNIYSKWSSKKKIKTK